MPDKLCKRVMLFGRVTLIVWLLAIAVWLQKLDSHELRDDVRDLNLLTRISQCPRAKDLQELRGQPFENATNWLAETDRKTSAARLQVRDLFAAWLREEGVQRDQFTMMSGKAGAPVERALPVYFISLGGDKTEPSNSTDRPPEFPVLPDPAQSVRSKTESSSLSTVAEFLNELDRLAAPVQLSCAVNVDENSLAKKHLIERPQSQTADGLFPPPDTSLLRGSPDPHDSPTAGPPNSGNGPPNIHMVSRYDPHADEDSGVPVLISAELNGDEIHIEYMIHYPYSDSMMVAQGMPQHRLTSSIAIPVKTRSVGDTTLLRLHDPDGRDNEQLEKLSATSERTSYLRQTYGHLPMASAVELANDGLTEAYRSVSLFGFSFSTRRLPFAILAFLATALSGTLMTLIAARRQGNAVLANPIDEYALDMLLGNTPGRILVWIVVPVSALLASHPLVPLPKHDTLCLSIGLIVVAALGVGCTWLSQQSRPATAN